MKGGFDLVVYVKYRFKKNKIYLYKKSININRKPMKTADAFIIPDFISWYSTVLFNGSFSKILKYGGFPIMTSNPP